MTRGKAEDAGGLTPAKDDNAAPYHFDRRTLPIFKCVDYKQALKQTPPESFDSGGVSSACFAFLPGELLLRTPSYDFPIRPV